MSNTSVSIDLSLNKLDKLIALAKKDEQRKKDACHKAKLRLEEAKSTTYQLMCARDTAYLTGLDGIIDWNMIFNYNSEETSVAYNYRKMVVSAHELKDTGHYNPVTKQNIFCIKFESDSQEELHQTIKNTKFIFTKLFENPDDEGRKCLTICNLLDSDGIDNYELAQNIFNKKYSILVRRFSKIKTIHDFDNLDSALKYIQHKSDVVFDTTEN